MWSVFSCACRKPEIASVEKCLFRSYAHFVIEFICFLCVEVRELLIYVFNGNALSNIASVNIFSHTKGCLLVLLIVVKQNLTKPHTTSLQI